jgi:hypothetical protein
VQPTLEFFLRHSERRRITFHHQIRDRRPVLLQKGLISHPMIAEPQVIPVIAAHTGYDQKNQ